MAAGRQPAAWMHWTSARAAAWAMVWSGPASWNARTHPLPGGQKLEAGCRLVEFTPQVERDCGGLGAFLFGIVEVRLKESFRQGGFPEDIVKLCDVVRETGFAIHGGPTSNIERRTAGQSHPKRHQSHPKAC